eukprot:CAMPEP_0184458818 /NCGR_PEP_ID=MMETSP0740-20130409/34672_1 /TAXON_ID=385413 /ORGANISM="Thalassiosira miniscula, Strain CCMP1093" /LENGTH=61 /DNA_ID=CAMNT_0026831629 /DNA_START=52 /DNA_END=233 /DNA_ORIENTATION=-
MRMARDTLIPPPPALNTGASQRNFGPALTSGVVVDMSTAGLKVTVKISCNDPTSRGNKRTR